MIFTFYSFKGGVGRSMAVANVAAWLSKWGQRILIVDWDLEAPGIQKYFRSWLRESSSGGQGIVDLVTAFNDGERLNWEQCLLHADLPNARRIDFLCAGRDDNEYVRRLRNLNWEELFKKRFGNYLEELRREWLAKYDFVLIDSRTGITDIGGICTIHLPDVLVAMFTSNEQSLTGVKKVLESASVGHRKLSVDRRHLLVIPVPARDESGSEFKLAEEWRERFAETLSVFFEDWVPINEKPTTVLNYLKIPYFAFWSFGERIPVLEQDDPDNPKTLAYAYQPLAKLILGKVNWKEAREGARATEEAQRQAAAAENARLEALRIAQQAKERELQRQLEASKQESEERNKRIKEYISNRVELQILHFSARAKRSSVLISWTIMTGIALFLVAVAFAYQTYFFRKLDWFYISVFSAGLVPTIAYPLYIWFSRLERGAGAIASGLDRQLALFRARAVPYAALDPEQAFSTLVNNVEGILGAGERGERAELKTQSTEKPSTSGTTPNQRGESIVPPTESGVPAAEGQRSTEKIQAEPVPSDYIYDVFLSFRRNDMVETWISENFLPLVSFWLDEELGRKATFFVPSNSVPASDSLPRAVERALLTSRCQIALLTASYFQSPACLIEVRTFMMRRPDLVIPVILHGGETFPPEFREIQAVSFREYFVVGAAFQQTERYIAFQDAVRNLAREVGKRVKEAPPFQRDFVIARLDDSLRARIDEGMNLGV
jgi:MinD-like ATPase involved in chromosome partitioning or flagellar assembly